MLTAATPSYPLKIEVTRSGAALYRTTLDLPWLPQTDCLAAGTTGGPSETSGFVIPVPTTRTTGSTSAWKLIWRACQGFLADR